MEEITLEIQRPAKPKARQADALMRRLQSRRNRGVYAQPASESDIAALHEMLQPHLERPIASAETASRIQTESPNSIWSIYGARGLVGGVAFLPLNALGVYSLIYGQLNPESPSIDAIAIRSERPVALYVWAVVATPAGTAGFADVLRQLDTQRFRGVDIWAQAVTPRGERLAVKLGLERIGHGGRVFFKYRRSHVW
jgi:hypothetical protein